LIFCKRIRAKGIKGCARAEERKWARRGSAWFTVDVGIVDGRRQYCGAPACNLRSLAAWFEERREGE
jgi:hypothetical protein